MGFFYSARLFFPPVLFFLESFFYFFFSLPSISSITNPSRFNVSFLLSMHDLVSSAHFAKMLDLSSRTESRYVSVPHIMCEKDKSKDTAATMRKSTVILETLRAWPKLVKRRGRFERAHGHQTIKSISFFCLFERLLLRWWNRIDYRKGKWDKVERERVF